MDQFNRFFWPTLRELMVSLISEGITPCPLWEGNCTTRLEVIKDLPEGKACYAFEATDLVQGQRNSGEPDLHTGRYADFHPGHGYTGGGKGSMQKNDRHGWKGWGVYDGCLHRA